jgi:tellurite resistance protein TerC
MTTTIRRGWNIMGDDLYLWIGFSAVVLLLLVLDLGVFHRSAHTIRLREAAAWTVVWVAMAMGFCGALYAYDRYYRGMDDTRGLEFLTGYIIEWSLSMDNVFVFAVILTYFAVPAKYQHEVLFWGILGAVVMRLVFILGLGELLRHYHWVMYVMGGFLILTGLKLLWHRGAQTDVSRNLVLRIARWCLPVTRDYHEQKFFVRLTPEEARGGAAVEGSRARLYATPLFLVLLVVEATDVAFAVDSLPAIFGITTDRLTVFSSNVFAILGLRSLYFLLAGTMELFRYLSVGLAAILCFVGAKMLLPLAAQYGPEAYREIFKIDIPPYISLAVVCGILALSIIASLLARSPRAAADAGEEQSA